MENETFKNLPEEKKRAIINGAMEEFVKYGFENASTNRLVKNVGISKGSLFQYFGNKEELYYYILKLTFRKTIDTLKREAVDLPADLLERMKKLVEISFKIGEDDPNMYQLAMGLLDKGAYSLQERLLKDFYGDYTEIFKLFQGIKADNLKFDLNQTIELVRFVMNGVKISLLLEIDMSRDFNLFKTKYMEKFNMAMNMIRQGIYKE